MNFGHFWALPFFKMSGFHPTRNFANFGPIPTFSAVRSTFLAEEKAHNLEFLPHPKFWPFLGRPLKYVLEFSNFWAGFVATQCPLSLVSYNNKRRQTI